MKATDRIRAFAALGKLIEGLSEQEITKLSEGAYQRNNWFTEESIRFAIKGILRYLRQENLATWLERYQVRDQKAKVGVVMAGNIPLVGFHDLLAVLLSGNKLHAKLSSKDEFLLPAMVDELLSIEPRFKEWIFFEERLNNVDAIIATGSDNSSRYFEYYFSKYPHIIRKNRTGCAVIRGDEDEEAFNSLGKDIFTYFGLGCRNVSKLYVPQDYSLIEIMKNLEAFSHVQEHHKYRNNYDYNKSIYLVNHESHLDNGVILLKESAAIASPISVVFYEYYHDESKLEMMLGQNVEKIQCIVSNKGWYPGSIPLGKAQTPELWDYADNVDTMEFLTGL